MRVNAACLRGFPDRPFPLLGIGFGEPESAAALVDLEAHTPFVGFRDPAELGKLLCILAQPMLEVDVVGRDLHDGVGFIEVSLGKLFFLFHNGYLRENVLFFGHPRPGQDLENRGFFSIEAAPMTRCITGAASVGQLAILPGEHRIIGRLDHAVI